MLIQRLLKVYKKWFLKAFFFFCSSICQFFSFLYFFTTIVFNGNCTLKRHSTKILFHFYYHQFYFVNDGIVVDICARIWLAGVTGGNKHFYCSRLLSTINSDWPGNLLTMNIFIIFFFFFFYLFHTHWLWYLLFLEEVICFSYQWWRNREWHFCGTKIKHKTINL